MKLRNAVVTRIMNTLIILLVACAPSLSTNLPKETAMPSATSMDLPLPTETATPTSKDDFVTQNCSIVLPAAPANFTTKGIIPLQDYVTKATVFLNLETGDETKIPGIQKRIDVYAVSPDHRMLAYKIYAASPGISLTLTDALNQHSQVSFVRKDDFALGNWLNNQQLLLGEEGEFVIFNPYTQQGKSYSIADFPGYDTNNPQNNRGWVGIDPQSAIAVYKANGSNIVLLDLGSKKIMAQIFDAYERPPIAEWTVDGSQAAIIGTTVVGKHPAEAGDNIFGVSRHGQVTQLTYLAEHYGIGFNIYSLSWSPDSRHIAFWMRIPSNDKWQLAVLDTSTKQVTDYCILSDPYLHTSTGPSLGLSAPIWSPDGKQLIVEHRLDDSKYVVLLDVTQNLAFQIAQNASPIGWMTR